MDIKTLVEAEYKKKIWEHLKLLDIRSEKEKQRFKSGREMV